ncbi:MAG: translation initiation factor, partial [Frankiales bacterium]|nr:translation initiation factor [Frankiales bacterium]
MDSLFDPVAEPERTAFLRRLRALVAPVAADAGAVVDDPALLDVAQAVYAAFGNAGASGGLTKTQIAAACPGLRDGPAFDARLDLFVRLGMLQPVFDKTHQQRLVFNPTSAAGLLVFERLSERGGVDELMSLLDRTRADVRSGAATREQVAMSLRSARHLLSVFADHLLRLVSSAPLSELIAERRHHTHADLVDEVRALTGLVSDAFPDLDPQAYRVVVQAQRYVGARESF